jgi:hypothetical protein
LAEIYARSYGEARPKPAAARIVRKRGLVFRINGAPQKGLSVGSAFRRSLRNEKPAKRRAFVKLSIVREIGAGEGIRTLDPNLGKVVLYP